MINFYYIEEVTFALNDFLQSSPHPALQKYIGQYLYVSFNTALLPSLKQTFFPYDIPGISFFIGPVFLEHSKEHIRGPIAAIDHQSTFAYLNALTTAPFSLYFKANSEISVFVIPFKPNGFSTLFRRNMAELTNDLPDFLSLVGASDGSRVLEQLVAAEGFSAQVAVLDEFFIKRIADRSYYSDQIGEACRGLMASKGLISIPRLAYNINMSMRTLERRFTEQVGVSPKLFARFKRFHHALALMNKKDQVPWADIAYECGYADQAHFIKEYKSFTLQTPSAYLANECLLYNQIILNRNFIAY